MRRCAFLFLLPTVLSAASAIASSAATTETIVLLRHGEKPAGKDDVGQLTCQGQNRALALPAVLLSKYGVPDAVFAEQPHKTEGDDGSYYSLRALATIEPTAIAAARTVRIGHERDDIDAVRHDLFKSKYAAATVFVAWEHKELDALAKKLVKAANGDDSVVPKWKSGDFDSLYVVRIRRDGASTSVTFDTDAEHLDGQPTSCAGMPSS